MSTIVSSRTAAINGLTRSGRASGAMWPPEGAGSAMAFVNQSHALASREGSAWVGAGTPLTAAF